MNIELKKTLIYITRDIERALGMKPEGNYVVISNETPYGLKIREMHPNNIWLIKSDVLLDTYDLLAREDVQNVITHHNADIVVFQNNPRIERLAAEKNWKLLNPSAELARTIEEKISQVKWLGNDANLLPRHAIMTVKDVTFEGKKFVLQFNHTHTGEGTYVIASADELLPLKEKFPDRECRVVEFISGPVFTVNAIVSNEIIVGNPSYQITGLQPFTDLPFSTIGNDWELAQAPHYKNTYENINKMAARLGERLYDAGWKGLFGIDVIYDEKANKTYLLEINARQPASAVYESFLQKKENPEGHSVFEAHIASLVGLPIDDSKIVTIESGSQIVKRATKRIFEIDIPALREKALTVMEYENTIHNKELLRIQSSEGVMEGHNLPNSLGLFIISCIR